MLPELDALGALLEANEEWQQDAASVRSRMLLILGSVADRYEAKGLLLVSTPVVDMHDCCDTRP